MNTQHCPRASVTELGESSLGHMNGDKGDNLQAQIVTG